MVVLCVLVPVRASPVPHASWASFVSPAVCSTAARTAAVLSVSPHSGLTSHISFLPPSTPILSPNLAVICRAVCAHASGQPDIPWSNSLPPHSVRKPSVGSRRRSSRRHCLVAASAVADPSLDDSRPAQLPYCFVREPSGSSLARSDGQTNSSRTRQFDVCCRS